MINNTDIYFPSDEILKTFIKNIWWLSDEAVQTRKEVILPKGTVEIIFNLRDPVHYHHPALKISKVLPVAFVNGLNFKPFELSKVGRQEFLGIQMHSIGLRLLFNLSVKEFNNLVYDGQEVCPILVSLANQLYHLKTFQQRVEIILNWISQQVLSGHGQHAINRYKHFTNLEYHQNLTVKKISQDVYLSDRQLRRFSLDWLGMNTEEFIHYKKYLHSLQLLHHTSQKLTDIGHNAGYYDQSHFIREFRSYTEMTPKQYRAANALFPGHIFD